MALSKFKTARILKKTNQLLHHKNSSLHISKPIKSVGIIVDEGSEFKFDSLKILQKLINLSSNQFTILTCKKTENSYQEFRGIVIKEHDFSWNGTLKSLEVLDFLNKPFDMLIDFTHMTEPYTIFLVAKSKALFKVGYISDDERLYDFMIEANSVKLFIEELVKYLKILKKIN